MWATVFLVPAFYLQGGAPAPEFDVGSGAPGLSAARYPGTPHVPAGRAGVEAAVAVLSAPTSSTTAPAAARPTSTVRPTTTSSTAAPPTTSTTAAAARQATTSSSAPPTTAAPATTTTTTGGVVVSLPSLVRPAQQPSGHTDRGVASWFGAPDRTCAHRTLPFGTVIKVTRVSTGAVTECKVADWGPADTSRVIDLSTDTFEELADPSVGLIDVVIEW